MRRLIFCSLLLLAMLHTTATAAQGPNQPQTGAATTTAAADKGQSTDLPFPERTVKFVKSDEPYDMVLFRADPKLLEQRYVAIVRFSVQGNINRSSGRTTREITYPYLPKDLRRLWYYGTEDRFSLRFKFVLKGVPRLSRSDYFQQLANRVPGGRRPDDDVLSFFAEAGDRGHLQFEPNWRQPGGREFRIMAPTAERCEQLANAMLLLFDYGLSRPTVEHVLKVKRPHETELSKIIQQQKEVQRRRDELVKELEAPSEVSREDLATLKTQRHLLSVELAGVMARLKAVGHILSRRGSQFVDGKLRQQVENIKITAEIDMAGLAARQEALKVIVYQGTTRVRLEKEQTKAVIKAGQLENAVGVAVRQISADNMAIDVFGPLPLINNQVIIRPIRWGGEKK